MGFGLWFWATFNNTMLKSQISQCNDSIQKINTESFFLPLMLTILASSSSLCNLETLSFFDFSYFQVSIIHWIHFISRAYLLIWVWLQSPICFNFNFLLFFKFWMVIIYFSKKYYLINGYTSFLSSTLNQKKNLFLREKKIHIPKIAYFSRAYGLYNCLIG